MENWEEMDEFLEIYCLLKLNQDEISNLNRPIFLSKIEVSQGQMDSAKNSARTSENNP